MLGRPSQTILRGRKFLNTHKASCDAILRLLNGGGNELPSVSEVNSALGGVEITECLPSFELDSSCILQVLKLLLNDHMKAV